MTRTEFSARYRILREIAQDGARSYTAQHLGTQRPVMVHFLDAAPDEVRTDLLARLDSLDATDRARIVERVEVDGAPVVVTQILSSFQSLPSWLSARTPARQTPVAPPDAAGGERVVPLESRVEAPRSAAGGPDGTPADSIPAQSVTGKSGPGEFTRIFGAPSEPARMELGAASPAAPVERAPPASVSPPVSAQAVPPPPAPSGSAEPGEFTRMFRPAGPAPAAPQPPAGTPARPAPLPPPPLRIEPQVPMGNQPSANGPLANSPFASGPLGNPQFANGPLANAPRADTPLAPPRSRTPISGSATGALEARPAVPEPRRPSAPPERAEAASSVPLDFPPPLPPSFASQPAGGGGSSSPLFTPSPPQASPPPAMPMSPAAPSLPHGPSEFTRVIGAPARAGAMSPGAYPPAASPAGNAAAPAATPAPAAAPAAAPPAASTAAPASSTKESQGASKLPLVPLLLALNLIVLVAVGLVVYFALKN